MVSNPASDEPSDEGAVRPPEKNPARTGRPDPARPPQVRHDQAVEFPVSETGVSQADGVP